MIEVLQGFPTTVLAFACKGHVTRNDYETNLIPVVESAMQKPGKVRLYYQINPDFSGIDAGAAWDDFKVGMHHLTRWERMAVVTDVEWIRHTIRAFGFLMPGDLKIFPLAEQAQAREWITQGLTP
jgi:hypothetical protein